MLRHTPARLALATLLVLAAALASACGGTRKPAESPDFTEKGWSGSSTDAPQAKADPSIQATPSKADDGPKSAAADKPAPITPDKPDKPEATSATEADVMSGAALPPPPPTKAAKPTKAKKPGKTRKKTAKNG